MVPGSSGEGFLKQIRNDENIKIEKVFWKVNEKYSFNEVAGNPFKIILRCVNPNISHLWYSARIANLWDSVEGMKG